MAACNSSDTSTASQSVLLFEGCNFLRQRLVLSTLSGRSVRIIHIREDSDEPGLNECEAGLIRLLDSITNGSTVEVSETGTSLLYIPGILEGGTLEHYCSLQGSIGYLLEPLLMLAPFAKHQIRITLHGITNGTVDTSASKEQVVEGACGLGKQTCHGVEAMVHGYHVYKGVLEAAVKEELHCDREQGNCQDPFTVAILKADYYRLCTLPLLKRIFPSSDGLELKINQRGVPPAGGGEVFFSCPTVKRIKPLSFIDPGKVKRVRGISYCVKVSPVMGSQLVDGAKGVLNNYLPDVFIYMDHMNGSKSPISSGYGVLLVSESTTGVTHAAEASSVVATKEERDVPLPEDLGKRAARLLLDEIAMGGCTNSLDQCITILFMALTQKDVSKVQLGQLTIAAIQFLQHLKAFFNIVYKVEGTTVEIGNLEQLQVSVSCLGVGFSNYSKVMV